MFGVTSCVLHGLSLKRPLAPGRVKNGLYLLQSFHTLANSLHQSKPVSTIPNNYTQLIANSLSSCSTNVSNSAESCHKLWHVRLGHMPISSMKNISFLPKAALIPDTFPCTICPMARQHKLPFPVSTTSTSHTFELIHIDTWGPYNTTTHDIFGYFLTIDDDFSRGTWTYLLSTKGGAFTVLTFFVSMVER